MQENEDNAKLPKEEKYVKNVNQEKLNMLINLKNYILGDLWNKRFRN